VFVVFASAFAAASSGCTSQGWYDPITGNRTRATAPPAIAEWSSACTAPDLAIMRISSGFWCGIPGW
jgi:hypothetical protein